jgi:hypothetical protein
LNSCCFQHWYKLEEYFLCCSQWTWLRSSLDNKRVRKIDEAFGWKKERRMRYLNIVEWKCVLRGKNEREGGSE